MNSTMKRNNAGKRAKPNTRNARSMSIRAELSDSRAYPGQQVSKLVLNGAAAQLLTTITTGVVNYAQPINTGAILGFSTRFGSTFDEYRIVGTDARMTPLSATSGVSKVWFDEKNTANPTANEAQERTSTPLVNSNANARAVRVFRWRARDLLDLQYTAIGTSVTPVSFKVYTDTASWAAPATVTPLWLLELILYFEFRGIKST